MKPDRSDKKSEIIKFRVPWRLKRDFMDRASREGRSASDLFRDLAEEYLRRPVQRTATQTLETAMTMIRKRPRSTGAAAVLGAAAISAVLSGVIPAGAADDLRAEFERLDANGDGVLTLAEMEGRIAIRGYALRPVAAQDGEPAAAPPATDTPPDVLMALVGSDGGEDVVLLDPERRVLDQADPGGVLALRRVELPAEAARKRNFDRFDTDGDGRLSLAEFRARHDATMESLFASWDANGDGAVSPDEQEALVEPLSAMPVGPDGDRPSVQGMMRMVLTTMDADGDEWITREEFTAAFAAARQQRVRGEESER